MISAGKRSVLGVRVDVVDYDAAVDQIISAARDGRPLAVSALAVHGVMTGVADEAHRRRLNEFDLLTPDGQPVKWALNLLYGSGLRDRVYGPELTWRVLQQAEAEGLSVFLYGSTARVLDLLANRLRASLPGLVLAGQEPSKFREIDGREAQAIAARITSSGARIVLVGLGCPRQETWVWHMRHYLSLPLLAVGAAFDYHAGLLRRPPAWMQRSGLEWLWRLGLEPRRLWRRYVKLNPEFALRLGAQRLGLWRPSTSPLPPRPELERFPG